MKKIDELVQIIDSRKEQAWYDGLRLVEEKNYLIEAAEELKEFSPKVAVMGEFSSGKSTLINSFLGVDLLPTNFDPTTKFNTKIQYSDNERLSVDGEEQELSSQAISEIDQINSNEINIYTKASILKDITFVDTPGTNDPTSFTDDIVFSLIGQVDIVLFVINSLNALKETEKQFLSKLIREKDIGKFFFVLNFADQLDDPRVVKNDFVERITSLLSLDRDDISKHTFLYSAKNALTNRVNSIEDKRYEMLNETMRSYIKNEKLKLLEDVTNRVLKSAQNAILLKLEILGEKLAGNTDKYSAELEKLQEQIESFELAITQEQIEFEKDFNVIKNHYKNNIQNSIKDIKTEIKDEISNKDTSELVGSRYIELRTKKLLEDEVMKDTETFMQEMKTLVDEFDVRILSSKKVSSLNLKTFDSSTKAKTIVSVAAVTAVAAGGVAAAPTVAAVVAGGSILAGLGAIAPTMIAVPVVGPILAGVAGVAGMAIPIVGTFALTAGKIMFDIGKWGVGILGDGMKHLEVQAKKMAYAKQVDKALSEIEKQIVEELNKIDVKDFKNQYINSKFPEKTLLEQKINFITEKQFDEANLIKHGLKEIEDFKNETRMIK